MDPINEAYRASLNEAGDMNVWELTDSAGNRWYTVASTKEEAVKIGLKDAGVPTNLKFKIKFESRNEYEVTFALDNLKWRINDASFDIHPDKFDAILKKYRKAGRIGGYEEVQKLLKKKD